LKQPENPATGARKGWPDIKASGYSASITHGSKIEVLGPFVLHITTEKDQNFITTTC